MSDSDDNRVLLARIDERTQSMNEKINSIEKTVAATKSDLKEELQKIDKEIKENYVSKSTFAPVQRVIYSAVGLILTAVVIAILKIVLVKV